MARVTNYARKFFGKRMQKVKVRRCAGKKSNRNRKEDDEDGGRTKVPLPAMTPTNVQSS